MLRTLYAAALCALAFPATALADELPGTETEPNISELDAFNGLIAIVLPFLVAVLTKASWDWKAKVALAVVFSAGAAIITTGLEHGWHVDDGHYVRSLLEILIASQVFYRMFKPAVAKVEAATS
jgi:hypothetical protein